MEQAAQVLKDVVYCRDAYDCAQGADALVIVTEWEQFRALDFERLRTVMAGAVLIDLRNVYRPDDVERQGFVYFGVGRGGPTSVAAGQPRDTGVAAESQRDDTAQPQTAKRRLSR
jgi:UDPglucose 6-dehydrogenase